MSLIYIAWITSNAQHAYTKAWVLIGKAIKREMKKVWPKVLLGNQWCYYVACCMCNQHLSCKYLWHDHGHRQRHVTSAGCTKNTNSVERSSHVDTLFCASMHNRKAKSRGWSVATTKSMHKPLKTHNCPNAKGIPPKNDIKGGVNCPLPTPHTLFGAPSSTSISNNSCPTSCIIECGYLVFGW